jgi:hypothetical protein
MVIGIDVDVYFIYMEYLKNIKWTPLTILKAFALFLVALIVLSITFRVITPLTDTVFQNTNDYAVHSEPGMQYPASDGDAYEESGSVKLSSENIGIPSPGVDGGVGGDLEDYEVTRYSVSIETRDRDRTCREVASLKELEYVVFENTNEYDEGCTYTFKVAQERVEEIRTVLNELDPKHFSENTYTIKQQLDDFTSETEILERKLTSINETLENAIRAYDEISVLATRTQDVESLAKIIDSKINTIERLTQQRITITAQLERLARGKAEQLDRLEYTYFDVRVYENTFVDGDALKESWKGAVKGFVRDVNQIAQDSTINLLSLLFVLLQYMLYFFILLVVVKYVWRATQYIWRK